MTTDERNAILIAGRSHKQYDEAIKDLLADVRPLTKTDDSGLYDWLWEGDYRDMPVIDPQAIADEWDYYTEQAS